MRQAPFVLLQYSPDSVFGQDSGLWILVLQEGSQLAVYQRNNWENGLTDEARHYLSDLITYWREAPPDAVSPILEELGELSVGPLQAIESGVLEDERRIALKARVLAGQEV